MCASGEEGCLPPRSRRSRASTATYLCRRRWLAVLVFDNYEYALVPYDTCRLLSRQIDVSASAATIQQYYYVFDLLSRSLPPKTCVKPNPDAIFGWGFHQNIDPLFLLEAHPKTISENGSRKIAIFRVYKIDKQDLIPENVHFWFRIPYWKR